MREAEPVQEPGIFFRPDPAPDGSRIVCAFDRRGVEVARFLVPEGASTAVVRFHLEALLNLHDPPLRLWSFTDARGSSPSDA